MKTKILADFQICISVPSSFVNPRKGRSIRSQIFFKIGVLKNFANFTRKRLCWSQKACNFVKNSLQRKSFPVNFCRFLETPFFTEHLWWLLLKRVCEGTS